jgi:hypothetical protein
MTKSVTVPPISTTDRRVRPSAGHPHGDEIVLKVRLVTCEGPDGVVPQ